MRLPLFASSVSLVTLKLTDIAAPGYFTPEDLVTQLQHLPLLEELSVEFSIPMPRPSAEGELLREPLTLTTLPSLKWLVFRGVGAYLEGLLARISSPLLERFNITLFTQLTFTLPHLSRFTRTTVGLRHPGGANVIFNREGVSFIFVGSENENNRQFGDGPFSLRITCKPFDWQMIAATQVCGALEPILSAVEEEVTLVLDGLPPDWRDAVDDVVWRELLGPFRSAKRLRISCSCQCSSPLAPELSSSALESYRAAGSLIPIPIPGLLVLPALQHLELRDVETGHTEAPHLRRPSHPVHPPPPPPPTQAQVERAAHSTGSFEVIEEDSDDLPPPPVSDPAPAKRNWFRRAVVDRVWKRLGPRTTRAGS